LCKLWHKRWCRIVVKSLRVELEIKGSNLGMDKILSSFIFPSGS
jgi:hypothetical protein